MSDARARRVQLMQAKQAEALKQELSADGFAQWSELPSWVRTELDATRRTTAVPDAVLPEKASAAELIAWMREFAGSHDGWYVLTGLEHFPWLLLHPSSPDWLSELVRVKGEEITLLTESLDTLIVFYAEEYEYQAFRRVRPS
jgi:hypothetical protein